MGIQKTTDVVGNIEADGHCRNPMSSNRATERNAELRFAALKPENGTKIDFLDSFGNPSGAKGRAESRFGSNHMPRQENFGHDPRHGFITSIDPRSARRQFRVSLFVAVALAVAIAGSAVALSPAQGYDEASQRAQIIDRAAVQHHPLDARIDDRTGKGG